VNWNIREGGNKRSKGSPKLIGELTYGDTIFYRNTDNHIHAYTVISDYNNQSEHYILYEGSDREILYINSSTIHTTHDSIYISTSLEEILKLNDYNIDTVNIVDFTMNGFDKEVIKAKTFRELAPYDVIYYRDVDESIYAYTVIDYYNHSRGAFPISLNASNQMRDELFVYSENLDESFEHNSISTSLKKLCELNSISKENVNLVDCTDNGVSIDEVWNELEG
jgi:hypothetical protein